MPASFTLAPGIRARPLGPSSALWQRGERHNGCDSLPAFISGAIDGLPGKRRKIAGRALLGRDSNGAYLGGRRSVTAHAGSTYASHLPGRRYL